MRTGPLCSAAELAPPPGPAVRIAMDGFGAGSSSLGDLRAFRFDNIKIDRSFIADAGDRTHAIGDRARAGAANRAR